HAGRGFEPAGENPIGEPAELNIGQVVAVAGQQRADQTVTGRVALPRDRVDKKLTRVGHRPEQAADPGGGIETGVADGPEPFTVGLRQTQQLTDDPERDRKSERFDQIDAGTGRLDNLELLINDLTD